MFANIDEVRKFIAVNGIVIIDLRYADVPGRWRHNSIPAGNFDERIMEEGIPFDSSSIPGFKGVECGDMAIIPDLSSSFVDPFSEHPTLCFICNICEADTKASIAGDPRGVAMRAEKYLKEKLGAESVWLPEMEFYLFDHAEYGTGEGYGFYEFDCDETETTDDGFALVHGGGYHAVPPTDKSSDVRSEMVSVIEEMGIRVKYHHHEVGPSGQNEIEIIPTGLVQSADAVMMMKYAIRMVANEYGLVASFMPKPLYNEAGTGMHFHQFLSKDGISLFWDENADHAHFSSMGKAYVSGLLDHADSIVGMTNPSTNSYKRLVPGFEAPTRRFYGLANRSAAIRIPKYDDNPRMKRCEFRPPDGTCNPYLAVSAQLMAGLDGIERELDPSQMGFGPYDTDVRELSPKIRKKIKGIPTHLMSALRALSKDNDYLLAGGVFDEGLIRRHMEIAAETARDVELHPTPREIELYFDI